MKYEIRNSYSNDVMHSVEADSLADAVAKVVANRESLSRANLYGANLSRANLYGANLSRANLYGANLSRANLYGANLSRANLSRANLYGANLDGASLDGASLSRANLSRANLYGANLSRANLDGASLDGASLDGASLDGATTLSTGESWQDYLEKVVPELLLSGGQTLQSFKEHWACHDWDNCPLAHAFSCHGIEGVPILLRPRGEQFVQFFDAKLILWEKVGGAVESNK